MFTCASHVLCYDDARIRLGVTRVARMTGYLRHPLCTCCSGIRTLARLVAGPSEDCRTEVRGIDGNGGKPPGYATDIKRCSYPQTCLSPLSNATRKSRDFKKSRFLHYVV